MNEHEDLSFKLVRPTPHYSFRTLECTNCGSEGSFEIALSDNGQWSVECFACNDSAVLLSDLINNLK